MESKSWKKIDIKLKKLIYQKKNNRLINHAKYLRDKQENQLCIKLLQILREMIPNENEVFKKIKLLTLEVLNFFSNF